MRDLIILPLFSRLVTNFSSTGRHNELFIGRIPCHSGGEFRE
jgi:hypothetical protein